MESSIYSYIVRLGVRIVFGHGHLSNKQNMNLDLTTHCDDDAMPNEVHLKLQSN